ncbi:phospho-sugar mutase [Mycoplasmopsis alligatoris]|nr:phospho-sugar mutase [Mycoplasmopsis alligatoris]
MKNEKYLDFGTAGIRGVLGPNNDQLNENYIYQIAHGIAKYINKNKLKKLVVIGRDNRRKSQDFALLFAQILAKNGIKVFYSKEITPTPFLSYLILQLQATIGINVTASHNPAVYNGVKLYNKNANQMLPDEIKKLKSYFQPFKNILNDLKEFNPHENIIYVNEEFKRNYIKSLTNLFPVKIQSDLKIAYSPQHGTGAYYVRDILYPIIDLKNVYFCPLQMVEDQNFTHSPNPNPESIDAYKELLEIAKKHDDIDLLITTDPDSDRVGIMVKHNNKFELLDGNQTATIIFDYLLKNTKNLSNKYMIYSYVSSNLPAIMAKKHNVKVYEVPTGFKWIGDSINNIKDMEHLFSFEESYGSLIDSSLARDKDALQSLVVLVKIAQECKNKNITLLDLLEQIYQKYSYVKSKTISKEVTDMALIKVIKDKFLNIKFPDDKITMMDYSKLENNPTEMIKYKLLGDSWIAYRPSGTEPKIKFYLFALNGNEKESQDKLNLFENIIKNLSS